MACLVEVSSNTSPPPIRCVYRVSDGTLLASLGSFPAKLGPVGLALFTCKGAQPRTGLGGRARAKTSDNMPEVTAVFTVACYT